MPAIIDLNAEAAKLTSSADGPRKRRSRNERAAWRNWVLTATGSCSSASPPGRGHWETHPGDELVHILDGTGTLEIVCDDGPPSLSRFGAGMIACHSAGRMAPLSFLGWRDGAERDDSR